VNAINLGNNFLYAGGLVGRGNALDIIDSYALGAKVIATGGATPKVGRVTGNSTGIRSDCYAWNGMLTGNTGNYDDYVPGANVTGSGPTDENGADTGTGSLKTRTWWETLGFTAANGWDHTFTVRDGRPGLKP
jgi:hypothetical protein